MVTASFNRNLAPIFVLTVIKEAQLDPVLMNLAFHRSVKCDWSLLDVPDIYVPSLSMLGESIAYPAESPVPMKRLKRDDGPF